MMSLRALALGAATVAWLLLLGSCAEDALVDAPDDTPTTGVIEGFTAPIDISTAEVVVFQGDVETRRVEFRDGQFRIAELPAGTYRLEVRVFGYQVNDAARDIELRAGESLDLGRFILVGDGNLMEDIPKVEGVVWDAVTKAPIPGVSVKVTCSAGVCSVQRATTGDAGTYTVTAPAEQNLKVSFRAEGFEARILPLGPISLGETRRLETELTPDLP